MTRALGLGLVFLLTGVEIDGQAVRVVDLGAGIYQAVGVGIQIGATVVRVPASNTFLVVTSGGNVVVDTSIAAVAGAHKKALSAVSGGPIQACRRGFGKRSPG